VGAVAIWRKLQQVQDNLKAQEQRHAAALLGINSTLGACQLHFFMTVLSNPRCLVGCTLTVLNQGSTRRVRQLTSPACLPACSEKMSGQIGELLLLQAINSPNTRQASGARSGEQVMRGLDETLPLHDSAETKSWSSQGTPRGAMGGEGEIKTVGHKVSGRAAEGAGEGVTFGVGSPGGKAAAGGSRAGSGWSMVYECEKCGLSFEDFGRAGIYNVYLLGQISAGNKSACWACGGAQVVL